MTGKEVIREARDYHRSFTPELHPDPVALREIGRAQSLFYQRILAADAEQEVAADQVFDAAAIAAAITGTPLTLPAHLKILSLLVAREEGVFNVAINQDERSAGAVEFHARLSGRSLYLAQPTAFQDEMDTGMRDQLRDGSPFDEADALRLTYVPKPTTPSLPGDTLDAPDEAKPFLVGAVAEFFVRRSKDEDIGQQRSLVLERAISDQDGVVDAFVKRAANETQWYVSRVG